MGPILLNYGFRVQPQMAISSVLMAGAHDLIVKDKLSNGYRDIEMLNALDAHFLKFDGEEYKQYLVKTFRR